MENTKKQVQHKTGMARLMQLAGTKKPLIVGAVLLSALASLVSFVPYLCIYAIVREVLSVFPNVGAIDAAAAITYGWWAFGGVIANILLYFAALMCSHLAAFGTLYELKVQFATHLARVPLGLHILQGSGKLRKIMDENIEKIEGFIAHQLPDMVAAMVAPIAMIVMLVLVDWRLAIAAVVGIGVCLFVQMRGFANDEAHEMMHQYQSNLEDLNNASVEYVRGMPVVKAFNQTVGSFGRLRQAIRNHTKILIPYTLSWQNYMSGFTTAVHNLYLFVLPVGIIIAATTVNYTDFIGAFIFFLLFLPAAAGILMKVLYVSESGMQIISGVDAMDNVLD
ncbi:MAG: ABC transporter transmembrane domain-containing protein, partial [Sporomusa sp.]